MTLRLAKEWIACGLVSVALVLAFLGVNVACAGAAPSDYPQEALLPFGDAWTFQEASLDPRSVQSLGEDVTLVCSRSGRAILIVRPTSRETVFDIDDYNALFDPLQDAGFFSAEMHGERLLIVSRWGRRVFEVQRVGSEWQVNWSYGDGTAGYEPNQLFDPFFATYARNGDVLIADDKGQRVLQVRVTDYDATEPANGFTDASIVWQFGEPGLAGVTGQRLTQPRSIEEMADGTMVILDTGHRAIRVRKTGSRTGEVLWTYGTPGIVGSGLGQLDDPNRARVLDNGNILISDSNNERLLEVDPDVADLVQATVWVYPADSSQAPLGEPRDAVRSPGGLTYIADSLANEVRAVGYDTYFRTTSESLDCGLPGVRKQFNSFSWSGETPPGTGVRLEYSVDGGAWVYAGPANPWSPSVPVFGTLVRYRITLTTTDRTVTPLVDGVTIDAVAAPESPGGDDDDDNGTPGGDTDGDDEPTGDDDETAPAPTPKPRPRRSTTPGTGGSGTGGIAMVPKSGSSSGLNAEGFDSTGGLEPFSDTLRGMALDSGGDGESTGLGPRGPGVFTGSGSGTGGPGPALALLGSLYAGGLAHGVYALRGVLFDRVAKGRVA